jgi:Tol biopolymer transport system component
LVENQGQVVTKEEIFRVVWEETAVTDNALTRAVAQIRKALNDDAKEPRFIETAPTVGYRFIGVLKREEPIAAPILSRRRRPVLWTGAASLLFAVAAFTAGSRLRPGPPVAQVSAPIPFTTFRGSETEPAFSPDGNQVAFQWDGENEDNRDIYVKVLGSETPLRLTTDPAEDGLPAWSPDGRTIAFVRRTSIQQTDLMLIPSLGGAERKLAELAPPEKTQISAPEWSPDGKWILISAMFPGPERSGLLRISVETGEASQLTDPGVLKQDRYPKVSVDGSMLLFIRGNLFSPGDIYAARIDPGGNLKESPHQIPTGQIRMMFARWSVDGREIIAAAPAGVFRFPSAGTDTPERIPIAFPYYFDISKKGSRMVMSSGRGDVNIWHVDLDSNGLPAKNSAPKRMLASTFRDAYPQYSPDGTSIAFYSNRGGGATQTWVAKVADQQARQVTSSSTGLAGTASW